MYPSGSSFFQRHSHGTEGEETPTRTHWAPLPHLKPHILSLLERRPLRPGPGNCSRAVPPDPGRVKGVRQPEGLQHGTAGSRRLRRPGSRDAPLPARWHNLRPAPLLPCALCSGKKGQSATIKPFPSSPRTQSCSKSPGLWRQARLRRGCAEGGRAVTNWGAERALLPLRACMHSGARTQHPIPTAASRPS